MEGGSQGLGLCCAGYPALFSDVNPQILAGNERRLAPRLPKFNAGGTHSLAGWFPLGCLYLYRPYCAAWPVVAGL